jgi:hypothetical protein
MEVSVSVPIPRRYLTVPMDPVRHMASPPCSPIPDEWQLHAESPPVQIHEFDLDAAEGVVQLGDGRIVDLAQVEGCGVVRVGAVLATCVAGGKRVKTEDLIVLPPIIVDSYE